MGEPQNDTPVTAVESGWDRIKRMYTGEGFEMEKDVCFRMGRTAFICGLVFGGLWTKNESTQRFQAYSAGKKFLGARDALVSFVLFISLFSAQFYDQIFKHYSVANGISEY